jgi:hypothetical protein
MSGTNIDFAVYPATNRVPGVFAELNNCRRTPPRRTSVR